MMKRITSLLMILALLVSSILLVACDDSTNTTKGEDTTTAPKNDDTTSSNDDESTTSKKEDDAVTPPANPTYTITVVDQDGNPVEGVMVQFCAGANCTSMFGKLSNAEGKIVITHMAENPAYEVAATVAPEEFDMTNEANTRKYTFDANNCLTITLTATEAAE